MKKYTFIALMFFCLPLLSIGQGSLTLNIAGYDAMCNGSANGSAKVTVTGGFTPYSYLWTSALGNTDSVSGLVAGIYSVTVTDNSGNTITGSVTINQPAPLVVSIDSIVLFPCFKPTGGACGTCDNVLWAVVSGGNPPYSYLWTPGTANADSTSDTLFSACYVEYSVFVTDNNGCVSSDSLNVTVPALNDGGEGVASLNNASSAIVLYPNPANNQLNISINQSTANSLEVYDMIGRRVFDQQLSGNKSLITIDISNLTNGDYLLRIAGDKFQKTAHFSVLR